MNKLHPYVRNRIISLLCVVVFIWAGEQDMHAQEVPIPTIQSSPQNLTLAVGQSGAMTVFISNVAGIRGFSYQFNAVLQKIWDEYANPATNSGVWQTDPDNGNKPLLLLYVGTDGPAIFRKPLEGALDETIPFSSSDALRWRIQANGTEARINQVFSIKYVVAGMASGWAWDDPYWNRSVAPPVPKP